MVTAASSYFFASGNTIWWRLVLRHQSPSPRFYSTQAQWSAWSLLWKLLCRCWPLLCGFAAEDAGHQPCSTHYCGGGTGSPLHGRVPWMCFSARKFEFPYDSDQLDFDTLFRLISAEAPCCRAESTAEPESAALTAESCKGGAESSQTSEGIAGAALQASLLPSPPDGAKVPTIATEAPVLHPERTAWD